MAFGVLSVASTLLILMLVLFAVVMDILHMVIKD